jgi:hypothetical protein
MNGRKGKKRRRKGRAKKRKGWKEVKETRERDKGKTRERPREKKGKEREEKRTEQKGKRWKGRELTYYLSSVDYFPNILNFAIQILLKFLIDPSLNLTFNWHFALPIV